MDKAKLQSAERIVNDALALAKWPAVMCSFGKDSLAVLHMVRKVRPDIPVIFHREAFMPWKYGFANGVISEWGLTVYDWPPNETGIQINEDTGVIEVVNAYEVGSGKTCLLPTGIVEPDVNMPFLCTLRDILNKPTGSFKYRWDMVLHGHKSSDVDPILGSVPLLQEMVIHGDCVSAAFPLRDWTDQDVWDYTLRCRLPIHFSRYDKGNGWKEHKDTTYNPDYFPACTNCLKPDGPDMVPCPKQCGKLVPNVSAEVRWLKPFRPEYVGASN